MIEVSVAMLILATVALTLADEALRAVRLVSQARWSLLMTTMATTRMEELRGLDWGLGNGLQSVAITDLSTDLSGPVPGSSGSGLAPSPSNTLRVDTAGFVDYLDARGEWAGTGTAPPDAVFVRRWRVSRVPGASDCLALEVGIDAVADGATILRSAGTDGLRLIAAKARKAE